MNSESLSELRMFDDNKAKFSKELTENRIITDGAIAEDFTKHPQWVKVNKQMEDVYGRLVARLDGVATLKEMYKIQAEMKVIKLLLNNPKSYIEKTKELHRRKSRWQTK